MNIDLFPDVWNRKGLEFLKKKEYSKAIKCFKKALSLNRKYTEAYVNLGITYSDAGLNDEAVKAYTKASMLDPLYIEKYGLDIERKKIEEHEIYISEARKALINSDKEKAFEFASEAVRLRPDYPDYRNTLAEINMKFGKFEQARFQLEKALEINPGYETARRNLAEILYLKGIGQFREDMKEEALSLWKKALSIYPNSGFLRMVVNVEFTKMNMEVKCTSCEKYIQAEYTYCPYCGIER